ncbi:MAG: hypothetical protein ACRC37_03705, partial [Lentisphaeria bacterium]
DTIFEVSTFRRKPSESERQGRDSDDGVMIWRDNEFGTLEEDAFRRDFTVNALFYNPITGELVDLVGGRGDMDAGIIRAIGDAEERILEDPVRMLRSMKLMAQYDFKLEENLARVIKKHADKIVLASKSRLFEEVLKIMDKCYSFKTIDLLSEYGLLTYLLPGVDLVLKSGRREVLTTMLQLRDNRKLSGKFYSDSRVLSLGTLSLPFIQQIATGFSEIDAETLLWNFCDGVDGLINHAVMDCFGGINLPKFVRVRLNAALNCMPRFTSNKRRTMLLSHPEYSYAREMFFLWLEANKIDISKFLDMWPRNSKHQHYNSKSHPKRGHVKRVRVRHKNQQNG